MGLSRQEYWSGWIIEKARELQKNIYFCFIDYAKAFVISYMEQVASPGLTHDIGCLGLVHWDDPEGRDEEGGGRVSGWGTHVHSWHIQVNVWQNQYNIVK